jgi:hypothetical protein
MFILPADTFTLERLDLRKSSPELFKWRLEAVL